MARQALSATIDQLPKAFDGQLRPEQRKFLAAYAETGSIRAAMVKSNVHSRWHYNWLTRSNDYSCAFEKAKMIYGDYAEGAIRQRGIDGYEKPLSYKGKLTGDTVREYSDALALAVIKALKPEYRDGNQISVGPAKISIEIIQQGSTQSNDEIIIDSGKLTP